MAQIWRRYFHRHLNRLLWGPLRNQNCLEKERIIGAGEGSSKQSELQTIVQRQTQQLKQGAPASGLIDRNCCLTNQTIQECQNLIKKVAD